MISQAVEDDNQFSFLISEVDCRLLAALRRILLSEIPTLTIQTVHIVRNESLLSDQLIEERLKLIPVVCSEEKDITLKASDENYISSGDLFPDILICPLLKNQKFEAKIEIRIVEMSAVSQCFFRKEANGYLFWFETIVQPPREVLAQALTRLIEKLELARYEIVRDFTIGSVLVYFALQFSDVHLAGMNHSQFVLISETTTQERICNQAIEFFDNLQVF
jgi:hypothetical protein